MSKRRYKKYSKRKGGVSTKPSKRQMEKRGQGTYPTNRDRKESRYRKRKVPHFDYDKKAPKAPKAPKKQVFTFGRKPVAYFEDTQKERDKKTLLAKQRSPDFTFGRQKAPKGSKSLLPLSTESKSSPSVSPYKKKSRKGKKRPKTDDKFRRHKPPEGSKPLLPLSTESKSHSSGSYKKRTHRDVKLPGGTIGFILLLILVAFVVVILFPMYIGGIVFAFLLSMAINYLGSKQNKVSFWDASLRSLYSWLYPLGLIYNAII